jgi:Bacterial aa3 type cytochrome c oxidase subunit IV
MAGTPSDYHRGDMDITEQTATFHLIMGMTKWGSLGLAALLLALVVWFCTPSGFMPGLISGLAVLVVGIAVLREKKNAAH